MAGPAEPRIGGRRVGRLARGRRERRNGRGGGPFPHLRAGVEPTAARFLASSPAARCRSDSNGYVLRVGFDTLIFMLLALGLNTVVGFAGLLDLGYVAFFGFGAYIYAMLASDQFGLHWPAVI